VANRDYFVFFLLEVFLVLVVRLHRGSYWLEFRVRLIFNRYVRSKRLFICISLLYLRHRLLDHSTLSEVCHCSAFLVVSVVPVQVLPVIVGFL